jgi:sulfur carrier protein
MSPANLEIQLNGDAHALPERDAAWTVADLLASLGLTGQRVAVERNGDVVPRARHGEVDLQDGDAIEVVTFVGGG